MGPEGGGVKMWATGSQCYVAQTGAVVQGQTGCAGAGPPVGAGWVPSDFGNTL